MTKGNNKTAAAKSKPGRSKAAKYDSGYVPTSVPLSLQQRCLDIFRDTLKPGESDSDALQQVKGHLYTRDFASAFGREEFLRVYASRWSPSRAIGYLQILSDLQENLLADDGRSGTINHEPVNVVCLGGGAGGEVVALAGWLAKSISTTNQPRKIQATFVDIAAWGNTVSDLHTALTTPRTLSKYASTAAKEANIEFVPQDAFSAQFHQADALELSEEQSRTLYEPASLVTLMFTLNELYSTSVPKTQQMLSRITASMQAGSHLLVVDSPGSYSTVSINGAEKKYPMQWLLDFTLVDSHVKAGSPAKWEKLVSDDSRWFRLPAGLRYPIELENMRYQIHLYRRLGDGGVD